MQKVPFNRGGVMKIIINNYGKVDDNGEYEVELQGSYRRSVILVESTSWEWRLVNCKGSFPLSQIMLTDSEHNEMLHKYWQWRKDNNIGWTNQTEQLHGEYTV